MLTGGSEIRRGMRGQAGKERVRGGGQQAPPGDAQSQRIFRSRGLAPLAQEVSEKYFGVVISASVLVSLPFYWLARVIQGQRQSRGGDRLTAARTPPDRAKVVNWPL